MSNLVSELRKVAPVIVRVYDASDEHRDHAVPNGRKRWSKVAETVDARPWVRAELLDKSERILGYVTNDEAPGDLEDLTAPAGSAGGVAASTRGYLEIILRAQREALSFRDKEHSALLASVRGVLEMQTQAMAQQTIAMQEVVSIVRQQRDEAVELAAMRAATAAAAQEGKAEGGDMDLKQLMELAEASPKLLQALGPLVAMFQRPRLPPPRPPSSPPSPSPPPPPPPPAPAPSAPPAPAAVRPAPRTAQGRRAK